MSPISVSTEPEDFEVWETESGNRIATFATAEEALAWVRECPSAEQASLVVGSADGSVVFDGRPA